MSDAGPDPLAEFARALLARESGQPLAGLLAQFPAAQDRLLDALLTGELDAPATETIDSDDDGGGGGGQDQQDLIGSYRLLRELGRGGQAVVFLAEDTRLGRRVALKILPRDRFVTTEAAARFRAEALTASRLDHPAICSVYETGEVQEVAFLAMQLVEGRSLAAEIAAANQNPGPYSLRIGDDLSSSVSRHRPTSILQFIETTARALHHAHEAGIVHRDVKPGNLMVRRDGEPVVLDFGLARDAQADTAGMTRTGDLFGTPAYMAPEQLSAAGVARSDPRTDVYALGVTLFEALCGERPYDAPTHDELFRLIREGRPRNLRRLAPHLPRDLRVVVQTAIDVDPARRYPTALDFAEDLRRLRDREPIRAEPSGLLLRGRRWVQRNPRIAASLVLLTAISLVALWQYATAQTALDEFGRVFTRLSDERQLADLERRYRSELWPVSEHEAAVDAWLRDAEALMARLDDHASRRDELRGEALPSSPDRLLRDRLAHPRHLELETLQTIESSRQTSLGTADALADAEARTAERAERQARLEARIRVDHSYRFDRDAEQVLHDASVRLAADRARLRTMIDRTSWLRERALVVTASESADRHAELWAEARRALAADPRFAGFQLRPSSDLLPIHRDPRSGLYEFAYLPSGDVPSADPATGSLQLTDEAAIVFVLLPGGRFTMGCQNEDPDAPNYDPTDRGNELYLADITLEPFFLGKYELTQHQWHALTGTDNPSSLAAGEDAFGLRITPRHPVENVDQPTARAVLQRSGLDLPTEAQWEYAMRAGSTTRFACGRDPSSLQGLANLFDETAVEAGWTSNVPPEPWRDGFVRHAPVDSFGPNPFGLFGMFGNVSEWCRDRFGYRDRSLHRGGDGLLLVDSGWDDDEPPHALRGGSYGWGHAGARAGYRAGPNGKDAYWGLRAMRVARPR